MLKIYESSKSFSLLCFYWGIFSIGLLQAQETKISSEIEKIYLHTDRSIYFIGEDIWYKAYNVRASNNALYENSNILYVELISPDSKIVARNKTNLEMGIGHGDFMLADSSKVRPGRYQLRAYTNWNRNFGEDFVFKKEIEIFDIFNQIPKPNLAEGNKLVQSNTEVINAITTGNRKRIHVDFFPEGGSLLENVAGTVGFKAVDDDENPIDVKGEVFDYDNEWVTSFASEHEGMGKFQMIPIEGKYYYAKIKTSTGKEFRVELPNAIKRGYSLNFKVLKGKNIITINTNSETLSQNPNPVLTIICKAKGISYLETRQTLTETSLSFELPKDITPEGISQITLYDNNSLPQSERLVFIEKEHDFEVQLTTDKASYNPEEKTTINLSSKSNTGAVRSGSFSLSVTDMNGVQEDIDFGTNICSYFLMESDIRGKVNDPGYYFDANNSKRLEHLDNLLLTQGWRDFLWKSDSLINENKGYTVEKGITISGRVKQLFGEKSLVSNTMTLSLINKKRFKFFETKTDSNGEFKFENLMFSGNTTMYLDSRNGKGKFRGEIITDIIEQPRMEVFFQSEPDELSKTKQEIVQNVFRKFVAFGVKPENILKEVKVPKSNRFPSILMLPEYKYIADEETPGYANILELLQQNIPGLVIDFNIDSMFETVRFSRYGWSPLFIIDGFEVIDDFQLRFVLPADVIKVEAIRGRQGTIVYGAAAEFGVIAITTRSNTGQHPKKETFHSIKKELTGYYTERIFYSPNPEKPNIELDTNAAVRNTLFWKPYLHPDINGNASVSFYNIKAETKVKVALEGITSTGVPVVKNTYYTIKKQQDLPIFPAME